PSVGPAGRFVPARQLACDHGGPDRTLGPVVGGLHAMFETAREMFFRVRHPGVKLAITDLFGWLGKQSLQPRLQRRMSRGERLLRQVVACLSQAEHLLPELFPR